MGWVACADVGYPAATVGGAGRGGTCHPAGGVCWAAGTAGFSGTGGIAGVSSAGRSLLFSLIFVPPRAAGPLKPSIASLADL